MQTFEGVVFRYLHVVLQLGAKLLNVPYNWKEKLFIRLTVWVFNYYFMESKIYYWRSYRCHHCDYWITVAFYAQTAWCVEQIKSKSSWCNMSHVIASKSHLKRLILKKISLFESHLLKSVGNHGIHWKKWLLLAIFIRILSKTTYFWYEKSYRSQ